MNSLKNAVFILLFFCSLNLFSQVPREKVSISITNLSFSEAVKKIEQATGYSFFYDASKVDLSRKVSLNAQNLDINEVVKNLLQSTGLDYEITNTQIALFPKENGKQSQKKRIVGNVSDETGEPIIGASIRVEGGTAGTMADAEGNFNLDVSPGTVLLITYLGFAPERVTVDTKNDYKIRLREDTKVLEEVVVIGYGTMKKSDVIGSISTVKSEALSKLNVTRADQALQGAAAGVMVSSSSGTAASTPVIKVRGVNSINLGTDPLWVVDGVVTGQGFMGNLNPDDIESIDILKDAAATAIYGSRASSGVVLVTTKSGKDKGEFTINYRMGISQLNNKDIFSGNEEYWSVMDKGKIFDSRGQTTQFDPDRDIISGLFKQGNETLTREQAMLENNDWLDLLTRTAIRNDISLSTSQKKDNWLFYGSFNWTKEDGVVLGNDFNRLAGTLKIQRDILKNLNVGVSANMAYKTGNDAYDFSFIDRPSWMKPYGDKNINPSGYWNALVTNPWQNPLLFTDKNYNKKEYKNYSVLSRAWAEYNLPWVSGLSVRGEVALNYESGRNLTWFSKEADYLGKGSASDKNSDGTKTQYTLYAKLDKTIGIHSFNAAAGYEYMRAEAHESMLSGNALGTNYDFMGTPGEVLEKYSRVTGENRFGSYFGRANYKLLDRYIGGVSFRRDGTYQFSKDNRWANFVAGSLGWIISSESFYNIEWMNLLKVRGSFGQTGNSNVPGSVRYNTFSSMPKGYGSSSSMDAYLPNGLGNDDIKWEKTNSFDGGIDFGFLGNRINGSIAYFHQNIDDLILRSPLPPSTGLGTASAMMMNVGKLKNYGLEFAVSSVNINAGGFQWRSDFNFTFNKNQIEKLSPTVDATGQGIVSGPTLTKKGQMIGTYYMAKYAGVDPEKGIRTIYEIDADHYKETGETVLTGNVIPATSTNLKNNRYIHSDKSGTPTWYGGFTNTFSYKNIDLSVLFTFAGGHYLYDQNMSTWMGDGENTGKRFFKGLEANSWKEPGDKARFPQISYMNAYHYDDAGNYDANKTYAYGDKNGVYNSSEFLFKGDYIRLKNLSLGYTLPKSLLKKINVNSLRLFVSATNLFTITDYEGLDVEIVKNDNFQSGVRKNQVPTTKTYTLGLNLSF